MNPAFSVVSGASPGEDEVSMTAATQCLDFSADGAMLFEMLLATISARFINLAADQVDTIIEDAQRLFCQSLGLDRSSLYQFAGAELLLTHVHQLADGPLKQRRFDPASGLDVYWAKTEDAPAYTRLNARTIFPWVYERIRRGEVTVLSSLMELPREAEQDRRMFLRYGTKSTVIVPLSIGGAGIGCLTFASTGEQKPWSESLVRRFRAIADVFANALARKHSDLALRESEERYRSIAVNLPGMVYQFYARDDGQWGMHYVDEHAAAVCGLNVEPIETFFERFIACVAPECRGQLMTSIREAIRSVQVWDQDMRFIKPGGEEVYLRGYARPRRLHNELVFSGILRDITERMRDQRALAESELRYRALFESAPVGIVWIGADGRVKVANPVQARLYGYDSPQQLTDFYAPLFLADKDRERATENMKEQLAGRKVPQRRYTAVRRDRSEFFVEVTGVLMGGLDREAGGYLCVTRDVTELVNAEEALRQSEQRFRQVAETVTDFIWEVDSEGLYTYTSPSVEKILGYAPQELVGKLHFYDLFAPDVRETMRKAAIEAFAGKQSLRAFPNTNLSKDGKTVHLETSAVPLLGEAGKLIGYRGADSDVTERKRAEAELRQTLEEVKRLHEQLHAENVYLRKEVQLLQAQTPIIGHSEALRRTMLQAQQVAPTDATVLILGETGTGKGMLAQQIHASSGRSSGPLVTANVAALPATLVESELFGREKGAYTGAMTKQIGRFEMADGGTLFLDEIAEMPLETQVKLLRVLQSGEFERLGSGRTIRVNVRVIAATNRDLSKLIREGKFRQDLFYRLNVFPISLPPLRERPDDIPPLVEAFVRELSDGMGKPIERIRKKDLEALQAYSWPGNVRELRNVVERSMILSQGTELRLIPPEHDMIGDAPASRLLRDAEKAHILQVLKSTGGKIGGAGGAAQILGLKPTTLYSMMKRLDIDRRV